MRVVSLEFGRFLRIESHRRATSEQVKGGKEAEGGERWRGLCCPRGPPAVSRALCVGQAAIVPAERTLSVSSPGLSSTNRHTLIPHIAPGIAPEAI